MFLMVGFGGKRLSKECSTFLCEFLCEFWGFVQSVFFSLGKLVYVFLYDGVYLGGFVFFGVILFQRGFV